MHRTSIPMLVIWASLLVGGCGQKGDLYLPEPEADPREAQGEEEQKKS